MEQKDIFQHIKKIKLENRLNTYLKNKLDIRKKLLYRRVLCYTLFKHDRKYPYKELYIDSQ